MTLIEIGVLTSVGIGVLALVFAFVALSSSRKKTKLLHAYCQRLERELTGSNSAAIGMGQRLIALEKRLLNEEKNSRPAPESSSAYPYAQATQLFQSGLDVDEVARRCGMSRAEASLLHAMQTQRAVA